MTKEFLKPLALTFALVLSAGTLVACGEEAGEDVGEAIGEGVEETEDLGAEAVEETEELGGEVEEEVAD